MTLHVETLHEVLRSLEVADAVLLLAEVTLSLGVFWEAKECLYFGCILFGVYIFNGSGRWAVDTFLHEYACHRIPYSTHNNVYLWYGKDARIERLTT